MPALQLVEVVLDLGRPALVRFPSGDVEVSEVAVSREDLDLAISRAGAFGGDNRAGLDKTLHRISCMRNRMGVIVGLTCRVGRAVPGSAAMVADLVIDGHSILLLGRPGARAKPLAAPLPGRRLTAPLIASCLLAQLRLGPRAGMGKTTAIREISRLLANSAGKRVVICDTSNEIGGDGDVPHPGIGRARRMQLSDPDAQHKVMIEAVENHMPQVLSPYSLACTLVPIHCAPP